MWFSDWISDVGNFITFIALAVYIHDLTGSVTAVGLALALRALPRVVIRPFAGVLADRMDRRRLMIASNLIRAVLVVGPAIGGLAVFLLGARHAFFLDAVSFLIAAGFQTRIASRGRPKASQTTTLHDVREGFSAVFRTPVVRSYVLLGAAVSLGYGGIVALLLIYVRDFLGRPEGMYGVVLSVAGLGTVIVSLAIAAMDEHRSRATWAMASVPGMAVFALAGLRPELAWLFPIALAFGLADSGTGITVSATIAEAMPDDVRGRVYAANESVYDLASAVGSLGFAWLGEAGRLGVVASLTLAAGVGAALEAIVLAAGGLAAIAAFERRRLAAIKAAAGEGRAT